MPPDIDPKAVFANAQLDLSEIDVYGFDYDYTLARYNQQLEEFIHDKAKQILVEEKKVGSSKRIDSIGEIIFFDFQYPDAILDFQYQPNSSVRGLHYDIEKGLLFKLDQFHNIQLGTVYRGQESVSDEEAFELYSRPRIPWNYVEGVSKTS